VGHVSDLFMSALRCIRCFLEPFVSGSNTKSAVFTWNSPFIFCFCVPLFGVGKRGFAWFAYLACLVSAPPLLAATVHLLAGFYSAPSSRVGVGFSFPDNSTSILLFPSSDSGLTLLPSSLETRFCL